MAIRIAVVGDYDPANSTHRFTDAALEHVELPRTWIATDSVAGEVADRLASYDGLWIAPSSPYRSMEGALAAIRYARERGVPLVGT